MDYKMTRELEENIKIKNKAEEIVENFLAKVKLSLDKYNNGKFELWSDQHNAEYIHIKDGVIEWEGDFLNNKYSIVITPDCIFSAIKNKNGAVGHIAAKAGVGYNPNDYIRK